MTKEDEAERKMVYWLVIHNDGDVMEACETECFAEDAATFFSNVKVIPVVPQAAFAAERERADELQRQLAEAQKDARKWKASFDAQSSDYQRLANEVGDKDDAIERLGEIGRLVGCDHHDYSDGRLQLVNCVEQAIDSLERQLAEATARAEQVEAELSKLTRQLEAGTRELRGYVEGNGFAWCEDETTVFNVTTAIGWMGGALETLNQREEQAEANAAWCIDVIRKRLQSVQGVIARGRSWLTDDGFARSIEHDDWIAFQTEERVLRELVDIELTARNPGAEILAELRKLRQLKSLGTLLADAVQPFLDAIEEMYEEDGSLDDVVATQDALTMARSAYREALEKGGAK